MMCYYCEKQEGTGGLKYAVRQAVAVCTTCGAGVCVEHAAERTTGRANEPIVCLSCRASVSNKALRESA